MNNHTKPTTFTNTGLYKGGEAFDLGQAAAIMKTPSAKMIHQLNALVDSGELHVVSEHLWVKPSRGLPFHWRKHPMFHFEAEFRQCLVL